MGQGGRVGLRPAGGQARGELAAGQGLLGEQGGGGGPELVQVDAGQALAEVGG